VAPTGWISTKFDAGDFYENLSRNSISDKNCTKIKGTLHEDLSSSVVAGDINSP
jgi:hypothetical protein